LFRSKFKDEDDLLNIYKCLPKEKYPSLLQKASVCAALLRGTYICEQAFLLMKLNKFRQRKHLTDENLTSVL